MRTLQSFSSGHAFETDKERYGVRWSDEAANTLACVAEMQQVTVEETGQNNQGGRYKYKTHADLNTVLKPIAQKHKCVILYGVVSSQVSSGFENTQTKKETMPSDKLMSYAYCELDTILLSVDNPKDWLKVRSYGFKVDQVSDKTLGAETIAKRYGLMKLANIPSSGDDDPDSDSGDVRAQVYGSLSSLAPQSQQAKQPPQVTPTQGGSALGALGSLLQ